SPEASPAERRSGMGGMCGVRGGDRKSTRLNSSHGSTSYAVFCLKKKNKEGNEQPEARTNPLISTSEPSKTFGLTAIQGARSAQRNPPHICHRIYTQLVQQTHPKV